MAPSLKPVTGRLPAIDAMRGLVMVLMTVDHASAAFNAGRIMADSAAAKPGLVLDPAQFGTRWITHLCAPTFVFLAGASLAIARARRLESGRRDDARETRFLVSRGLFIAACDPLWMSWAFGVPRGTILLQVLYAIGGSFVAMAALRRLPAAWLGALGLAGVVGHEALGRLLVPLVAGLPAADVILKLLVTGGQAPPLLVAYPLLPWLSIMMLGHAAGALVVTRTTDEVAGSAVRVALVALVVFAVVRGLDGYGNAGLHRDDGSVLQWLHVAKYPPSLSYTALELGLMALTYAALSVARPERMKLFVLLGQTAFFYYLLHVHLLEGASYALELHRAAGLGTTYLAAAIAVGVLAPLCALYRRYKLAHPSGLARYV